MATVDLRVELPACSHSFQIQVISDWTIKDVKAQIHLACKGAPRVDGQRLIWRGRFLRDEEVVKDIWKVRLSTPSSNLPSSDTFVDRSLRMMPASCTFPYIPLPGQDHHLIRQCQLQLPRHCYNRRRWRSRSLPRAETPPLHNEHLSSLLSSILLLHL